MIVAEKPGSPAEVLEHVGVKGMRWGVRKAADTAFGTKSAGRRPSSYKKSSTKTTTITKTGISTKKKVAIGVGVAATVAVGAGVAIYLVKRNGRLPVSQASKMYKHVSVVHPPPIKIAPRARIIRPEIAPPIKIAPRARIIR